MSIKALIFALAGAFVALVYAIESFLYFKGHGISGPLFIKLLICGIGIYFFAVNIKKVRGGNPKGT